MYTVGYNERGVTVERLINHPRLKVARKSGSEGPSHDPYGYEELKVITDKHEVIFHRGLGDWLQIDGEKVNVIVDPNLSFEARDKATLIILRDQFAKHVGYTVAQIERIGQRLHDNAWQGFEDYSYSGRC